MNQEIPVIIKSYRQIKLEASMPYRLPLTGKEKWNKELFDEKLNRKN